MAKEYIERDKVLSHKWKVRSYDPSDPDPVTEVVSVSSIMRIPAADVVEVVRCRDCKYWCEGWGFRSGALGVYQCAIHGDYPSGEYFCADGERKDDDGE